MVREEEVATVPVRCLKQRLGGIAVGWEINRTAAIDNINILQTLSYGAQSFPDLTLHEIVS